MADEGTGPQAPTPGPLSGHVYVEVSGLTGTGKSAVMGEIEIALKALGLPVEHGSDFQAEKNGTHADWQEALDLYKPVVVLRERNVSRLAPTAPVEASGQDDDLKLIIAHTIIEDLRVQHPDIEQIDNERGDIWLPGGSTPQSSGCIVDIHSVAQSVEQQVLTALRPGHTDLMVSPESIDAYMKDNPMEAKDEGAAGEASAYRVRMISNDPAEWVLMHPEKALDFLSRKGWESQPLYPHPSPTPAADADRVRMACEIARDALKCEGPEHELIYQRDRSALDRIATGPNLQRAIAAALKSEGAK